MLETSWQPVLAMTSKINLKATKLGRLSLFISDPTSAEWFFARAVATLDRQSRSIWLNIFEGDFSGRRVQFPSRIIEFANTQIQEHIQASSVPDSISILNKVQDISKQLIEAHASQAAAAAATTLQSAQSSASMIMSAAASATSIQNDALLRVERRIEQETLLLQEAKEALRLERLELQSKQDTLNQESLALNEQYQQAKNDLSEGQRLLTIKATQLQQETGETRKALEAELAAKSRELRSLSERNLQDQKVKQAALDKREKQLLEDAAKLKTSDETLAAKYASKLQALEDQRIQLSATKKDIQQQQRDTQNALAEAQRLRDANAATAKELALKSRTNQSFTAAAGRKQQKPPRHVVIESDGDDDVADADDDDVEHFDPADTTDYVGGSRKHPSRPRDDELLRRLYDLEKQNAALMRRLDTANDAFSHFKSSRQRDSDDDDIVPATDVEDEASCMAALSRWSRVERQLGHSEKATGAFISSTLKMEYFESEWRRRLSLRHDSSAYLRSEVERSMLRLLLAYKLVCAKHTSYKHAYEAAVLLRLEIEEACRLELQIAGTTHEGYDMFDTDVAAARAKNRRGKSSFIGLDGIVARVLKKHPRLRRGDGGRRFRRPESTSRHYEPQAPSPAGSPAAALQSDTASVASSSRGRARRR